MKITPVIEELILKLHADGLNCKQISAEIGCSHMSANKVIRQAGLRADYKINRDFGNRFSFGITSAPAKPIYEYTENGLTIKVYPAGFAWGYECKRTVR